MDHAGNLRAFAGRLINGSLDQRGILAAADEIERLTRALDVSYDDRHRLTRERDEARAAFDAFAASLGGKQSMVVQMHDPAWAAWKRLCDAFAGYTVEQSQEQK